MIPAQLLPILSHDGPQLVYTGVAESNVFTDTLGLSDTVVATVKHRRVVSDTLTLSDSVLTGTAGVLTEVVADTLGLSDSVLATVKHRRTVTDTLALSDSVLSGTSAAFTDVLADTLGLSDSVLARVTYRRTLSDTIRFSDEVATAVATAYYVRADGTATKANATGPASNQAACMSVATFNAAWGTFSSGDTIYFSDQGGDYTTDSPLARDDGLTIRNAPGETPVIRRSTKLAAGTSWTLSGSVYYTSVASIPDPTGCWVGSTTILGKGSNATLSAGQFWPDTGNDLLYVRLADDSDPGLQDIYLGHNFESLYLFRTTGVTVDGLTFRHGSHASTRQAVYCFECTNTTLQNCTWEYLSDNGVRFQACDGSIAVTGSTFRYLWNGKPYISGGDGSPLYYSWGGSPTSFTWQGNTINYCYVGLTLGAIVDVAPTVTYNIIANSLLNALALGGNATYRHTVDHNTIYHRGDVVAGSNTGHGVVGRTSLNTDFRSNLIYHVETAVGQEAMQIDSDSYDHFGPSYNCYHGITEVDGETDPQHIWSYWGSRSNLLADWQAALVAAGYGGDVGAMQVSPHFYPGYAPSNPQVRNAGHDGITIGAVEYIGSGPFRATKAMMHAPGAATAEVFAAGATVAEAYEPGKAMAEAD
jgi:hypothetical protein